MAIPVANFLESFTAALAAVRGRIPVVGPRHNQFLLDSGRALMMLAAVVLTHQMAMSTSASSGDVAFLLLAFMLWLLGAALMSLSFVARQFPGLAAVGVTVASALRNYLLGGL